MTLFPRILKNSIIRFIEILSWSEFQGASRMLRGARLSPNALAVTLRSEEVSREHLGGGGPGWPAVTGVYVELLHLSCCKNIPTSSRNNPHYHLAELCAKSLQSCPTLCEGPLSMGFSSQESRSGLLCPPPGDLPDPGIKLGFPSLQAHSLLSDPPVKPTSQQSVNIKDLIVEKTGSRVQHSLRRGCCCEGLHPLLTPDAAVPERWAVSPSPGAGLRPVGLPVCCVRSPDLVNQRQGLRSAGLTARTPFPTGFPGPSLNPGTSWLLPGGSLGMGAGSPESRRSLLRGTPRYTDAAGARPSSGCGDAGGRAQGVGVGGGPPGEAAGSGQVHRSGCEQEHTASLLQALRVPTGGADWGVQEHGLPGHWSGLDTPR